MSGDKKTKKKCCGKYKKKGKHCGGCPLTGDKGTCRPDKGYCADCDVPGRSKKDKKKADKKDKKGKDGKKKK